MGSHSLELQVVRCLTDIEFLFGYYSIRFTRAENISWRGRSYDIHRGTLKVFYVPSLRTFIGISNGMVFGNVDYEDFVSAEEVLIAAGELLI